MEKVPVHIKKAIRESAKHYAKAIESNKIVRDWIDSILGEDYSGHDQVNHDMWLDQLIDGTEISYNPNGVIKTFENFLNDRHESE